MRIIELTRGQVTLVDDTDFANLQKFNWCYHHRGYAIRTVKIRNGTTRINRTISMHQQILGILRIDHKDGNGLNNQRSNLRPADASLNQYNRRKLKSASSKFKGVSWHVCGKWEARITVNRRTIHLGLYINEEDAAIEYNIAARKHFGKFARVNDLSC